MSLFKRNVKKDSTCSCGGNCKSNISNIKVLGSGCKSCHQMYENTKQTVQNVGLDVEVEYITDMEKVMQYGAISMPVLVIDETIVSVGKVLKPKEIEKLLK